MIRVILPLLLFQHGYASRDDPVLPHFFESWVSPYATPGSRIPRQLWVNVGSFNRGVRAPSTTDKLPEHMHHIHILKEREKRWTVNLVDDAHQQQFMKTLFANTSTYWAYQQINPRLGVAKSDIWRYAQLLLYGGGYLDEDSTLEGSLDVLVKADDAIILTKESNTFSDECFKDEFHASDSGLARRFGRNTSHINIEKVVANWAFFVEPKHPVFRRALENIVELVRLEHQCRSALKLPHFSHRWKMVMCVTGPTLLTVSVKEVLLESPELTKVRLERRDFTDWGGRFKVDGPEAPKKELHYMLRMQRDMLTLLGSYIPSPLRELELLGVERAWEREKEREMEGNETSRDFLAPLQLFTVFRGQVRLFNDDSHARIFGYVTRKAIPVDPAFFSLLSKGPEAPKELTGSDLGKARLLKLEGKIVCTVSQHHQRAYFVIANGSSQAFLSWDHLTAVLAAQNKSHDDAEVLDEEFVKSAHLLPIGGFYGQEHLGNDELVSTSSGALYVLRNHTRSYCSFGDWDRFTSSRFAPSFRKALRVHEQRIRNTLHGGECVD